MNIYTKVSAFMFIGASFGCFGTDMTIEKSSNVFEIIFDRDNTEQYKISLAGGGDHERYAHPSTEKTGGPYA